MKETRHVERSKVKSDRLHAQIPRWAQPAGKWVPASIPFGETDCLDILSGADMRSHVRVRPRPSRLAAGRPSGVALTGAEKDARYFQEASNNAAASSPPTSCLVLDVSGAATISPALTATLNSYQSRDGTR